MAARKKGGKKASASAKKAYRKGIHKGPWIKSGKMEETLQTAVAMARVRRKGGVPVSVSESRKYGTSVYDKSTGKRVYNTSSKYLGTSRPPRTVKPKNKKRKR